MTRLINEGLILKTGEPMRASGEEARMTSLPVGFLWGGGGNLDAIVTKQRIKRSIAFSPLSPNPSIFILGRVTYKRTVSRRVRG